MTEQEPQILPADEAKARLRAAIEDRLGPGWDDETSGWAVVSNHAYMARLNRGRTNIDFHVDYFTGEVTHEVKEVPRGQDAGRAIAVLVLLVFAALMIVLARGLGWV